MSNRNGILLTIVVYSIMAPLLLYGGELGEKIYLGVMGLLFALAVFGSVVHVVRKSALKKYEKLDFGITEGDYRASA